MKQITDYKVGQRFINNSAGSRHKNQSYDYEILSISDNLVFIKVLNTWDKEMNVNMLTTEFVKVFDKYDEYGGK